jgi:hypothetical protein
MTARLLAFAIGVLAAPLGWLVLYYARDYLRGK